MGRPAQVALEHAGDLGAHRLHAVELRLRLVARADALGLQQHGVQQGRRLRALAHQQLPLHPGVLLRQVGAEHALGRLAQLHVRRNRLQGLGVGPAQAETHACLRA